MNSDSITKLLEGNLAWVKETIQRDPQFFENLAKGQSPEYLWIGCSDSRVPANEITNTRPGDIFVHRNIANMVVNTDINLLSVIYYAVKYLKVKHILVVGHYGCGGVMAAMSNQSFGFLDNWLVNIKNVYSKYQDELDRITDENKRGERLVELNVIEQVRNLAKISFIQEEWKEGNFPQLHGFVYGISNGKLIDLEVSTNSSSDMRPVFRFSSEQ
jgi:carbonic anhydrase